MGAGSGAGWVVAVVVVVAGATVVVVVLVVVVELVTVVVVDFGRAAGAWAQAAKIRPARTRDATFTSANVIPGHKPGACKNQHPGAMCVYGPGGRDNCRHHRAHPKASGRGCLGLVCVLGTMGAQLPEQRFDLRPVRLHAGDSDLAGQRILRPPPFLRFVLRL